jgi:hypothetical protein
MAKEVKVKSCKVVKEEVEPTEKVVKKGKKK